MAKYKDKWKTTFPTSIGNQTRPEDSVDNTQEYNTDGLPQYMANDPVRYDLQNAVNSQLVSNDERLNEKIKRTSDDLAAHNKDPKAHATGIAGNAATATKLQTPRTLSLTGKAAGSATFDGSSNASINVTSVNADTASKLSTARKINITGNATGSGTFDGSGDVNINTTVNRAAYAVNAENDSSGASILSTYLKRSGGTMAGALNFANTTWNLVGDDSYIGDHNIGGTFCVKGANGETGIALINVNNEDDCARISYGGGNINFNKTIGGNISGNADNATKWNGIIDDHTTENNTDTWIPVYADGKMQHTDRTKMTVGNADTVDGYHENSFLRYRGAAAATGEDTLWNQIGIKEYDDKLPKGVSGTYSYGAVVSLPGEGTRLDIWYNHPCSVNGDGLWYRSGWHTDQKPWARLLDSNNYNNWAPTKTGGGASGTWGINISGNASSADSATNADKLDGYHASDLLGKIYPVGSIYMSMSATNPHDLFGVGTWERISQGRMLLGADDSTYNAGATGGEATHTLTAAEMPAHSHGISTSGDHSHYFYGSDGNNGPLTEGDGLDTEGNSHHTKNVRFTTSSAGAHTHTISNSGGSAAHNNMSPYLVCYIWQRTA